MSRKFNIIIVFALMISFSQCNKSNNEKKISNKIGYKEVYTEIYIGQLKKEAEKILIGYKDSIKRFNGLEQVGNYRIENLKYYSKDESIMIICVDDIVYFIQYYNDNFIDNDDISAKTFIKKYGTPFEINKNKNSKKCGFNADTYKWINKDIEIFLFIGMGDMHVEYKHIPTDNNLIKEYEKEKENKIKNGFYKNN